MLAPQALHVLARSYIFACIVFEKHNQLLGRVSGNKSLSWSGY